MWLLVFSLWSSPKPVQVWRCVDKIVDTGERTKEGRKILELIRTDCRWEELYLPVVLEDDRDYD